MDEENEIKFAEIFERLGAIEKYIKALEQKIDSIDDIMYDEILNPLEESFKEYNYNTNLTDFVDRNYDTLNPYIDRIKAIEGDDFDVYKQAFDDYNAIEGDKPDEAEYVRMLSEALDEQLEKIRQSLGVSPEAEITITDKGAGQEPIIDVNDEAATTGATDENEQKDAKSEVELYEEELEKYLPKK